MPLNTDLTDWYQVWQERFRQICQKNRGDNTYISYTLLLASKWPEVRRDLQKVVMCNYKSEDLH